MNIGHAESVEDFAYVLVQHDSTPLTAGSPPILLIVDKIVDEMQEVEAYALEEDDLRRQDITLTAEQSVHRSIELIEGNRDKNGLIQGESKVKYKDKWMYARDDKLQRRVFRRSAPRSGHSNISIIETDDQRHDN